MTTVSLGYPENRILHGGLKLAEPEIQQLITQLCGSMGRRFVELMKKVGEEGIDANEYNCFGTVNFLTGASRVLDYTVNMREQGEEVTDILGFARAKSLPLLFQVIGDIYESDAGSARRRWRQDVPLHAGFIIGESGRDDLHILEKVGADPIAVASWNAMYGRYFPPTKSRIGKKVRVTEVKE